MTAQATTQQRFECGVCWQVYDPATGDPVWQIPAGTAFADLPEQWCCPNCDAPPLKFLRLVDDDS
jgi:rubredoxin